MLSNKENNNILALVHFKSFIACVFISLFVYIFGGNFVNYWTLTTLYSICYLFFIPLNLLIFRPSSLIIFLYLFLTSRYSLVIVLNNLDINLFNQSVQLLSLYIFLSLLIIVFIDIFLKIRYPRNICLPIINKKGVRSLNLSVACGIAIYEAHKQLNFHNINKDK